MNEPLAFIAGTMFGIFIMMILRRLNWKPSAYFTRTMEAKNE